MTASRAFSDYPAEFAASSRDDAPRYRLMSDRFAVHGPLPSDVGDGVEAELLLGGDDEALTICRGDADRIVAPMSSRESAPLVAPVYAIDPAGHLAVPTGMIFVRFARGVDASERAASIAQAGYDVVEVPPYAPHAAWVRARAGGTAAALRDVHRLEALDDVANVEPQMLRAVSRR